MIKEIRNDYTTKTKIKRMGEGNTLAEILLEGILNHAPFSPVELDKLDDMNIRGEQIASAFNVYCKKDFFSFLDSLNKRDPEMVKSVNIETAKNAKEKHKAVVSGAKGNREMLSDEEVETLSGLPTLSKDGRSL